MTRPLLGLAAFFGLGAWIGQRLGATAAGPLALGALLLGLALRVRGPVWPCVALGGAAFALGAGAAAVESRAYDRAGLRGWAAAAEDEEPVRLVGQLARDPWPVEDRWSLLVDASGLEQRGVQHRVAGRARITVGGASPRPDLRAGDRVAVWATLRPPRGFANPGSPDTAARARREGVHAVGYCKTPLLVERLAAAGDTVAAAAARLRGWARVQIAAHVPPGSEEALIRAMLLGDRSGLDPETEECFRIAGTYHVLALSGAQVALVAGALLFGLRRLETPPALTAALVSGALAFYALLVGGDVPIVRAVVMAAALLLGRGLDLDADLPNLLGLSALALLAWRPSSVGDVGFQLSFGATLGILLMAAPVARRLPSLPLRLELALAASVAAQIALTPLLAAHFHRLAPASLVLNLAAVPLSGAVLLAGALVVALGPLSTTLALRAGDVAWALAHTLLRSADVVRSAPWLDVRVPGPSLPAATLYAAGLLALLWLGRMRLGCAGVACGLALILIPAPPRGDGRLYVTALDVGQGDAIVVRTPGGRVWLIDAGAGGDGRLDMGEAVVAPYLWSLGIRRVDGLVLTHAHPDHVGGAPSTLRSFGVASVWEGLAPRHDPLYAGLDRVLQDTSTIRLCVTRGLRADWDGVRVEVLAPERPPRPPWTARNDDSVVLALRFGDVTLMLAGDIERPSESRLPATRADVLKVPHHGSRTSSSAPFLAATRPRVAIVSAGFRNRFGHPHAEVLERYHRLGCRVFRTDRDGAVTVSTDGRELRVETFEGEARAWATEASLPPRGL